MNMRRNESPEKTRTRQTGDSLVVPNGHCYLPTAGRSPRQDEGQQMAQCGILEILYMAT